MAEHALDGIQSLVLPAGGAPHGHLLAGSLDRRGGVSLGFSFVRPFGPLHPADRQARGLGGQELDDQHGPGGGHAPGDARADGEAAQERLGGGVLQRVAGNVIAAPVQHSPD